MFRPQQGCFLALTNNVLIVFSYSQKINALPIPTNQQLHDDFGDDRKESASITDPFYDIYEQTKNLGQQAMDRLSDTALSIGSTVGDFASELFQQGSQHTAGIFSSGQEIVTDNFEQVKRFGEAGLNFLKKAVTDTSTFFSDNLPKFPFLELDVVDRQDTYSGMLGSDNVGLNSNIPEHV